MRKFWRKTEGFTLVELIVVIAILGILAGVGTVGYSGYIKKANMAADQTLVRDVAHALELAYYADPSVVKNGYVALSVENAPDTGENTSINTALEKVFGAEWTGLRLKYDGWSAEFEGSNFGGSNMQDLVGKVDDLTGALGAALEAVESMGGAGFTSYMTEMLGENPTATQKANASVFYVADKTAGLSYEALNNACDGMVIGLTSGNGTDKQKAIAAMNAMNAHTGSSLSSAALMYAMAYGFAEYYDEQHKNDPGYADRTDTPSDILDKATADMATAAGNGSITNAEKAFEILGVAFQNMLGAGYEDAQKYAGTVMDSDAAAYADALKTVGSGKDSLLDENNPNKLDLTQTGCFTGNQAVEELLDIYSEGGVFVFLTVSDTNVKVSSTIGE